MRGVERSGEFKRIQGIRLSGGGSARLFSGNVKSCYAEMDTIPSSLLGI
jgi:hypothetical protein